MASSIMLPAANDEYLDAIRWYLRRNAVSRDKFEAEVKSVVARLENNPLEFGELDDRHRQAILVDFPYRIIYRIERDGSVAVVAVAHTSRDPDYWRRR